MAAHALLTLREAHPDRAHEAVLVQVQDHPRPRGPRRRQCPPAERGVEVVRVHHPRPRAAYRVRHPVGVEAPAQQPRRRSRAAHRRPGAAPRIPSTPRQQLRRLPQALAHQPQQVVHHALLPPGAR